MKETENIQWKFECNQIQDENLINSSDDKYHNPYIRVNKLE